MAKQRKDEREEKTEGKGPAGLIGGSLNLLGINIDLGELLSTPSNLVNQLEELREKLKDAGGKEVLSAEEWKRGGAQITGFFRTRGVLGEREFHIGTLGQHERKTAGPPTPEPPEVVEPPVDVFDEDGEIAIVADVPGVTLEDLELKVEEDRFSLTTRAAAARRYQKELHLGSAPAPGSLRASCHNGVLEVRLKKAAGE